MIKNKRKRKAIPSNYVGNGEQRNVSYGELAELEKMFKEQVKTLRICFESKEERDEALFDFIQQYIDGNDDPQVNFEEVYTEDPATSGNPGAMVGNTAVNRAGPPPKAPIQAIDPVKLAAIEQHLNNGRLGQAMLDLENIVGQTGDTRCRVALYRLLQYLSGNSGNNKYIDHHVLLAAKNGHICSMNLVYELDYHTYDTRYWRRLSDILDPEEKLVYNIDHFKSIDVVDVIDALHEPDSHFYNAVEAKQQAIKLGLTAPGTLHYDEATFFNNGDENLLDEARAHMRARNQDAAEISYNKLESINPTHGAFAKSLVYHSLEQYDKFAENVKKGADLGIVAHMYILSAIYRCGFGGVTKSPDLADAWFWLATQCDNQEYRGLDTVFDFDFLPLKYFLVGWKYYFDNPSFQFPSRRNRSEDSGNQ